ncbi:MAG: hypothetical protein IKI75_11760 [Lachnospiraceae bacterium]|nr:hypothetical protein [Lachnospiraceae bacterium]
MGNDILRKVSEVFFWLGLFCELCVSPTGYIWGGYHENAFIMAGLCFFSLSLLCSLELWKDVPRCALLFGFALICYYFQNSALILRLALALMAGRRIDRRKAAAFMFFATAGIMLAAFIVSLMGYEANPLYMEQSFRHVTERRYCFGFIHTNGFSLFWIRLAALGAYLFVESLPPLVLTAAGILGVVPLIMSRSKAGIAIYLFLLAATFAWKFIHRELFLKTAYLILSFLGLFLPAFIYTLGLFPYPEENVGDAKNLWDVMNVVTTGRLSHARRALVNNPVPILGLREVADGTEVSYVNSLYKEGVIFIVLFFLLAFFLIKRLYREKDGAGMILLTVTLLYLAAESFLPYFNKNPMWLLMIAGLPGFMMPGTRKDNNHDQP